MTSQEFRRQRRQIARNRTLAAQLLASKRERDESDKRERAARASARFALQHHLPPERIYEPQPQVVMSSGFGGLRPTPTAYEIDRRSRRVDAILQNLSD